MRYWKTYLLFAVLLSGIISAFTCTAQALEWPETSLTPYGKITFSTGYADVTGYLLKFIVQEMTYPGFYYTYLIDMGVDGEIGPFYLDSTLVYPSKGDPDLTLLLESDKWLIEDQPKTTVKIPQLTTTFNQQRFDGFKASRRDGSFHLFYGKKYAQTRSWSTVVFDEGKLSYDIFSPTDGDMVEGSEIVFLQGKRLQRYIDYKVNYIDGGLKFFIPLQTGAKIEVRYDFLPTGYTVNDRVGGVYYQQNEEHSYGSLFYFDETTERLVEKMVEHEVDGVVQLVPEEFTEVERTQYLGAAVLVEDTPLTMKGEVALTDPTGVKNDYAGNLDLSYTAENANLQYQLTMASPDFTGVGVVPVSAGETHQLSADYQWNPKWRTEMQLSRVKKGEGGATTLAHQADTDLLYQLNPRHALTLSVDASSFEEYGLTTSDLDYQLGWKYQITDAISLALENSLKELQRNKVLFTVKSQPLRLNTEYKQYPELNPFADERWIREFNTDWNWRPLIGVTMIGDIDYQQPFDEVFANSKRRLALTLIAAPGTQFSARSNFIYFYNPVTIARTLFYDLASTVQLPYQMQLDGTVEIIQIDSEALTNTSRDWTSRLSIPLTEQFDIALNMSQDARMVDFKNTTPNQGNDSLTPGVDISYQLSAPWSLTASTSFNTATVFQGSATASKFQNKFSISANYLTQSNQFSYKIDYVKERLLDQYTHQLVWKDTVGPLQYDYSGEYTHPVDSFATLKHNETLEMGWNDEQNPLRPSLNLYYQYVNIPTEKWCKFGATGKLAYEFSKNKAIFIEIGRLGNENHLISPDEQVEQPSPIDEPQPGLTNPGDEPVQGSESTQSTTDTTAGTGKSFWSTFIKIGLEYSF